MQKSYNINFYATLGVSLLTLVILAALTGAMYLVSTNNSNYNSSLSLLEFGFFLVSSTLFLSLPTLINSRYGWKTVVTTMLFQSILIFSATMIVFLVTASGQPSPYSPGYGSYDINSGAKSE